MRVIVVSDEVHRKEYRVKEGDREWWIDVEREYIDDYRSRWRWQFSTRVMHGLYWNPPPAKWYSWEGALEDALNYFIVQL